MGMPGINIAFSEAAVSTIQRGERGIVALILRDENIVTHEEDTTAQILSVTDIPSWLSEENKEQIQLALLGYVNAPKRVLLYIIDTDDEYTAALKYLETVRFDYLVVPTVQTDVKTNEIVSWIKTQRDNKKRVKAVLPNTMADTEGIINFATEKIYVNEKEYTTEQYCSRIAGIIAGTPVDISCTYAPLTEVTDCTRLSRAEMKTAIESGKLIVYHDGEKVKINAAVNSLTTTSKTKGERFKKIKIVDAMDMMADDITRTVEDNYIGKYANSYDNKCLLLSAIGSYFKTLKDKWVLNSYSIEINVDANKTYLESKGTDTTSMSDDELKQANTDNKVFLKGGTDILDAMEELELPLLI
ncbi:MAG: phage tail sheath subtilisin-like domain-containing protein [Clostridiales bacterium]|nr:phage tail sheath subtilisin-like domain-containing protein [Clostridiales bacterium]